MPSFRLYPVAIPDEIIKEILSPVLEVPDNAFVHPSLHSGPFTTYKLTSSTILEVCKAWLRVATPLLYETVILRSKAQAQALALALQGNPDLDRFVKKARIEGGYGDDILKIFKRCPSLRDLWISAALWSNKSVAGYSKAFHHINPQKLIVFDDPMQEKDSKIRKAVYSGLGEAALSDWTDLVRPGIPK
jgi:F-box-like